MPVMFYSLFHHTVQICDANNFTRRQNEFLEIGLTKGPKELGKVSYKMLILTTFGHISKKNFI